MVKAPKSSLIATIEYTRKRHFVLKNAKILWEGAVFPNPAGTYDYGSGDLCKP